jgi:AbiV family abortive infection protein
MSKEPEKNKGRLKEYGGSLTIEQIVAGMNAAKRNARRLAADARLMLDAKRLPTAVALAALSIEESGKNPILRGLAITDTPEGLKEYWQQYRDHRSKNGYWILPELFAKGARKLPELREVVNRKGEHTAFLNGLKQLALYTDCYESGRWSEPESFFLDTDSGFVEMLVQTAELLAKSEEITVREMELWVEHLKPVWLTDKFICGFMNFARAMDTEGLGNTTAEEYARFMFGDVDSEKPKTNELAKH